MIPAVVQDVLVYLLELWIPLPPGSTIDVDASYRRAVERGRQTLNYFIPWVAWPQP